MTESEFLTAATTGDEAAARAALEQNPALADLQACASLKDAQAGTCLVTEQQKREEQARVAVAPATVALSIER